MNLDFQFFRGAIVPFEVSMFDFQESDQANLDPLNGGERWRGFPSNVCVGTLDDGIDVPEDHFPGRSLVDTERI